MRKALALVWDNDMYHPDLFIVEDGFPIEELSDIIVQLVWGKVDLGECIKRIQKMKDSDVDEALKILGSMMEALSKRPHTESDIEIMVLEEIVEEGVSTPRFERYKKKYGGKNNAGT